MKIDYRQINASDFDEIRQFFILNEYCWRDSDPEGFIERSEEKRDSVAAEFLEKLKNINEEKYHCLAAFNGEEMIASHFLDIYMIEAKLACHIHALWVNPSYRGYGIARKLKEMGEVWARKMNCVFMDSNTKVTNTGMIALNKDLGYSIARYNFRKTL
ncbi:MAG: hypothetical protein COW01_11015 [Bdellovibrionales bacterium CG12_big_fil_rev_8_21_14_0_65_38_15]|nr:MAG: hypothetical protein COW79_07750 [Bdellovibrionales bacterium CG22_combo_CG10-13_8_21_14_all_38_13]PIQ54335.1 MAG: hypothetical protein COW01_11015 [Bdellovibrionales bacterium CG12_big_fil_rev_8_21_14_0_65_38_15]PIR28290.1 MAG: hypothetical protein COV38_16465 [Bdellovibrionales bacterium CG11_big_fil_rev_8_21_14_0_20_38_13]